MGAQAFQREDIIKRVMESSQICHIAMVDENGMPYVLPFNFGIDDEYVWFHSGPEGKKINILKSNPNVCVNFSSDFQLGHRNESVACSYFMNYRSILINGQIEFIEDFDLKIKGMNIIMKQYTKRDDFNYNNPAINNLKIFRLKLENISGRSLGY